MALRETYHTQRRAAPVARSWGPGDRQQLRDFFTGVGLREAQGIGVGDPVELIHEGQVTIGRVAQVHGLQALVDLGNDVSTVRGLEDLLPASRDGLDQTRRASIRQAVRGITQKSSMWVEGLTPMGGPDYRIALGHDPHQPPTQTEVLRFVAAQYPGVRVLDGETVRPGLMRLVIARGEGHEVPGLTGPDAHGGGAFDSVLGPDPRGFDDARYDERDSEHIGGPGLAVAELRSAEIGEVSRREAIINSWVESRGRRPNVVEYAKVAYLLRGSHRVAQAQGVASDLASRLVQERESNPTAEKSIDRVVTNYLARDPAALDNIDLNTYGQILRAALQWLQQFDPEQLDQLRQQFAADYSEDLGGEPPTENLGGVPPPNAPALPAVPARPEVPSDDNSMNESDETEVPEDKNDWYGWREFLTRERGGEGWKNMPGYGLGGHQQKKTLPQGTKVYPADVGYLRGGGPLGGEPSLGPEEVLTAPTEAVIMKPLDKGRTLVYLQGKNTPYMVYNDQTQRTAALGEGEKPRMPPAAAGFRVHVASVRSRGAYIEAKMKFDAETAQDISPLGLKRALSTALERQATHEWYRYGFLGKIRILDLDRKKGTAVLECQSSQASNFPLEFVGPNEEMEDRDGYL